MTQKKEKESFVLHLDMLQDVKHMGIEEKAQFLDFVINYNEGRASIDDLEPGMFKSFMRLFANQFDRDTEKWEKTRQRRSESGRKGGLAKSSKCYEKPSKCYEKPSKAKHNVNVNVNVNKNENENGEGLDAFNNAIDFPGNHPEKLDDYLNEKPW
jgi:hypothetical protein